MPSTKKIIKRTLREQGVTDSQLERYGDTITRVAEALDANPQGDAQQVVTQALGSRRYDVAAYVAPVVTAVMAARRNGSGPQDAAPSLAEATVVTPAMTEAADRLRTFAASRGLPSDLVEEGLAYAGMTTTEDPEPTPEPGPETGGDVNSALDLLATAVQALRSALR